jgi:hypothetical protein
MNNENYFQQINLKNRPEPTKFTQFLWWCAGADSYFLKLSPKQDRVKYAGIGGVVLTTGVLAMLSGYLAFKTAFGTKGATALEASTAGTILENILLILGGLAWGLVIFNLDRFIISSTSKGDGTDEITGKEWKQAAPRLVIACILGVVVSSPLETQILKSDIDQILHQRQEEKKIELNKITEGRAKQANSDAEKIKKEYEFKLALYEKELVNYDAQIADLTQQVRNQMENGKVYGFGPVAKKLQENVDAKKAEKQAFIQRKSADISLYRKNITDQDKKLEELRVKKENDFKLNELEAQKMDGILNRVSIAHETSLTLSLLLLAVFLCIETGPIIFKMMLTKGVYDYMVENYNHRLNAENGIFAEDYVYEGKDGLLKFEKHVFLEHEETIHEKKLKSNVQRKITEETIKKYEGIKLNELNANPENFFTDGPGNRI